MTWVKLGTLASLSSSARHHITLREQNTGEYHSLLLFSFPSRSHAATSGKLETEDTVEKAEGRSCTDDRRNFYCMEATCPHLGAPLENATLEDQAEEDEIEDMVVVCPWHEYDFSLRTGESSTGVQACVYAVDQRPSEDGQTGEVWIQAPQLPSNFKASWDLVELRPVSESFSSRGDERASRVENREIAQALSTLSLSGNQVGSTQTDASSSILPPEPVPKSLVEWACLVLRTPEPRAKVAYTRMAAQAFRTGAVKVIGGGFAKPPQRGQPDSEEGCYQWKRSEKETPPLTPPRLDTAKVVQPHLVGRRGKGGTEKSRIALLHSLANIEQWAIDLAWDIIARGPELAYKELKGAPSRILPVQFYTDFLKIAEDEAKHFSLLVERIESMGSFFGSHPVHHGLWESALDTMHSLPARLSVIHLVHEARGLDVNPTTIMKFKNAKDLDSVKILTIIHLDEITHVSAGHRWLSFLCAQSAPPKDPVEVFRHEVRQNFSGKLKGPFNSSDRCKAGLSKEWYDDLEGQKRSARVSEHDTPIGVQRMEVAGG